VSEPPPVEEPDPGPPPPITFAPPVAAPLPTLPEPTGPASLGGWPAPDPSPPPSGQQAPWPPTGHLTPKPVPSSATLALVLGVTALFCGFTGPFAIHYGLQARREQAADPSLGGRGLAAWGLGLGVLATAFLILTLILVATGVLVLT
jgi:hypothetical protein